MVTLDDVTAGLAANEFFLQYLPTVRLDDDRCVGCEALVRWRRPSGVVAPSEFIPLVENTPLARELTHWVLERVAVELGGWLRTNEDVHVGINLPPELLGHGIVEFITGHAALAGKLVLEVPERVVSNVDRLEALNASVAGGRGIRFALDEVGESEAGVAALSRVRVPILKLARTVTSRIGDVAADGFIRDVAGFARVTGTEVVAVGVERPAQAVALREAGISLAQGWLYSHPIPAGGIIPYHLSRLPVTE